MENLVSRRKAVGLVAAALAGTRFVERSAAASAPVLVELFTSQGCSSCPPADKLAGLLRDRDDALVVSFNVDYWDYIGWKDTLAKPEFTARQRSYALARGDGQIYTPQMVMNGVDHVVGSQKSAVDGAISSATAVHVSVAMGMNADAITIDVGAGDGDGAIWLMAVAPEISVNIERGENTGKTVAYHNVVRKLTRVGEWKGEKTAFKVPRKPVLTKDSGFCIAVLQSGEAGRVVGLDQSPITQA